MPNGPFVARNGLISLDSTSISGSLTLSGGKLGIGTTTPTASLDVSGSINLNGTDINAYTIAYSIALGY